MPTASFRPARALVTSLLASASTLALLVCATPADALCMGCSSPAGSKAAVTAAATALANAQAAAAAAQRAQASMTRATQALAAMRAAQAAANALARSAPGSAPDGIVAGGLMPVANPLPAAQDATGLQTWEGASQPTQTTGANGQGGGT